MAKTGRRKKRTHVASSAKKDEPKSFVFRRGKHSLHLKDLEGDLRKVMLPNTALNLRESRSNLLKDFVHVAGPLGVTHFLMLTATPHADYLRVAKTPRGPTLTMRLHSYSLIRDVVAAQQRPKVPSSLWKGPPLLVMNNFSGSKPLQLATVLLQNLFPAINVNTVKLASCQRVLLLHHDKDSGLVQFRHYAIHCTPTGVSKGIKALLMRKNPGDLSNMADVADLVMKGGYGSESEGEEAQESRVDVPEGTDKLPGLPGRPATKATRVRVSEVGPRLTLEVIKVEEGLAAGKVLYHKYVRKSSAEEKQQQQQHEDRERLRAQRRRQQEDNVRRKQRLKELEAEVAATKQAAKGKGSSKGPSQGPQGPSGPRGPKKVVQWWEKDEQGSKRRRKEDSDAEDDVQYYRQEVGEEPDPNLLLGTRGRVKTSQHGVKKANTKRQRPKQ